MRKTLFIIYMRIWLMVLGVALIPIAIILNFDLYNIFLLWHDAGDIYEEVI